MTVDAILTSDWHLRESIPICRVDNFWETQWYKISQISELQSKYNCPVIHAGDLFHHWKTSPFLLSKTIEELPKQFYTVYGNHDLPNHNIELDYKSGIFVLEHAGVVLRIIKGGHWGVDINKIEPIIIKAKKIAVTHIMTWKDNVPWPDCKEPTVNEIIDKLSDYDLILTGHNHRQFMYERNGTILLNPGCISRQKTYERFEYNIQPSVYLWNAEKNEIKQHTLDYKEDAVSNEHIKTPIKFDKSLNSFVVKLDSKWESDVDFETVLDIILKRNKVRKPVVNRVMEMVNGFDNDKKEIG
jgi:putative phosphoesterase